MGACSIGTLEPRLAGHRAELAEMLVEEFTDLLARSQVIILKINKSESSGKRDEPSMNSDYGESKPAPYSVPNSDLNVGDHVIVTAHPEWGAAVVSRIDDQYTVLVSYGFTSGRRAIRVGRGAVARPSATAADEPASKGKGEISRGLYASVHQAGKENPVLQRYLDLFGRLGKLPDKPVLLLAILAEIDAGRLKNNFIGFPPSFSGTFSRVWKTLVSHHSLPCDIGLPFRALARHDWWLLQHAGKPVNLRDPAFTFGAAPLGRTVDGARFTDDLWDLLTKEPCRSVLKATLLRKSFPDHVANQIQRSGGPASYGLTQNASSPYGALDSLSRRKPQPYTIPDIAASGGFKDVMPPFTSAPRITEKETGGISSKGDDFAVAAVKQPGTRAMSCSAPELVA